MNNFYAYIKLLKNGIIGFCPLMLSNVFQRKFLIQSHCQWTIHQKLYRQKVFIEFSRKHIYVNPLCAIMILNFCFLSKRQTLLWLPNHNPFYVPVLTQAV